MKSHWLALALTAAGCFGPRESDLFEPDDRPAAGGGGAAPSANAGTGSSTEGSGSGRGGTSGGEGATGGSGGSEASGSAGIDGGSGAPPTPETESCESVLGSVVSPENGHCYRLNEAPLSFEEASAACQRESGHLLTVSSPEENEFTRDLHPGEHWLGATDRLGNDEPGVGTYVWVTGEPWEFSDWEDGQPNAFANPCPEGGDDHGCFEHCGFQTPEGDWNDRSCWHTIASICEWDVELPVERRVVPSDGGASPRPNGPR